jgi:hypothetical protein
MNQTVIRNQRLRLAAHLGHPAAIHALGAVTIAAPTSATELAAWLTPLAEDRGASMRFMLALTRSLVEIWRRSPYPPAMDDTLDRLVRRVAESLDGKPILAAELGAMIDQLDPLYEPVEGVFVHGVLLEEVLACCSMVSHHGSRDYGATLRREDLATLGRIAQTTALAALDFTRGPFADASREVARWLLGEDST